MISLLIFIPIIAGLLICLGGRGLFARWADELALGVSIASGAGLLFCAYEFAGNVQAPTFVEFYPWIKAFGINYFAAITPLNVIFLVLTAVLMPVVIFTALRFYSQHKLFIGLLLIEQGLLTGVFAMQNLLLWFFFWELTLVPAFILIKEFGGQHRSFAAYKFFLYTVAGSLPMLLSLLYIFYRFGTLDFSYEGILGGGFIGSLDSPGNLRGYPVGLETVPALWVFLGIFLGVAVKVPLYPLQSWQQDAYVQAPFPVSMFMTGIMSKMGVYGLLILFVLLPVTFAEHAWWIMWLAAITMIVSITVALMKNDLKEIIAYSSLNHVAICALGIGAVALTGHLETREQTLMGVMVQTLSHGLSGALLFLLAGIMEDRLGTRKLGQSLWGLRQPMPVFAGFFGLAAFVTIGLPGLSGFIGEFLIFKGALSVMPLTTVVALLSLIPMTMVFLKVINRVLCGSATGPFAQVEDLSQHERVAIIPLVVLIIFIGLWPQTILWIWS